MLFIYNKFKLRKWRKFSPSKRLEILQALENKLAKKNHRDPIPVIVHERADWNCFGMFSVVNGEKLIYVHQNLLLDPDLRFHALETIIHEGRHATQFVAVTKKNLHWWNFREKRWKVNFAGYVNSTEDSVMYNNQEVERDAQRYTIRMLEKLEYKYHNEEDFYKTIRRNVYRYEKAEQDARKKYGLFYRFKMRKRIDDRSKWK